MHHWSRERYELAVEAGVFDDARVELLDGEIIEMSPQSDRHAGRVRWLRRRVDRLLDPDEWLVGSQEPVVLSDESEPEPDLWVARVADPEHDRHPRAAELTLVVEVSWDSYRKDRFLKRGLYARAGIPEYWIVDLRGGRVRVHRQPDGDEYREERVLTAGDVLAVPDTDVVLDVAELLGG